MHQSSFYNLKIPSHPDRKAFTLMTSLVILLKDVLSAHLSFSYHEAKDFSHIHLGLLFNNDGQWDKLLLKHLLHPLS
jgi:hypothetical protein